MADNINVATLPSLPMLGANPSSPAWLNPTLFNEADLFFCRGSDLVSESIASVTDSFASHVGMLTWLERRAEWYVIESVADAGVHEVPLSRYLTDSEGTGKPYDGSIVIGRVAGLSDQQATGVIDYAYGQMGKAYNKTEIAEILAHIVLRVPTVRENNEQLICSELVLDSFQSKSITLSADDNGFVAPGDELDDPLTQVVGCLLRK